jgi:hypothetical protein
MRVLQTIAFLLLVTWLGALACKNGEGPPEKAPESAAEKPAIPSPEQLQQWTQTEEGLNQLIQFIGNPDMPLEAQANAVVTLVEAGKADRIRRIVAKAHDPAKLAKTVAAGLIPRLQGKPDPAVLQVRNALLILLDALETKDKERVQKALAHWAFEGLDSVESEDTDVWFQQRFPKAQLSRLGSHAVEPVLTLVQDSAGVGSATLRDCTNYLAALEEEKIAARAVEAFRKRHDAMFDRMGKGADLAFRPDDLLLLEKLGGRPALAHLLYLSRHDKVDAVSQIEALIRAKMLFDGLPGEQQELGLDQMLATIIAKLSALKDATGRKRLEYAGYVLKHTRIPELGDVSLTESAKVAGRERLRYRPYMGARVLTPERFVWGVAGDFLRSKVAEQRLELAPEQGLVLSADEYAQRLAALVERNVTSMVESWLDGQPQLRRIFGIAGLRYLGTPKAMAALEALKTDTTDLSIYFGDGATTATLAGNALTAIELSGRLAKLERQSVAERRFAGGQAHVLRRDVLSRMALPAAELRSEFETRLDTVQSRYDEHKQKVAVMLAKYHKAVRMLCFKQIDQYPPLDQKEALQAYVDSTAAACRKVAEEKLFKAKLDYFAFTDEHYRSAVVRAIMKKETIRKYMIKATARSYLLAATGVFRSDRKMAQRVAKLRKWELADARTRKIVDKIVRISLEVALEDHGRELGPPGLSAADIAEYGEYIELPEKYVLGALIVNRYKLIENSGGEDEGATGEFLLFDLARRHFAAETYFEGRKEVVEFLEQEHLDAWYVLSDTREFGPQETWKRWGLSEAVGEGYMRVHNEATVFVDGVVDQWVAEKKLPAEMAPILKKNFPCTEIALEILLGQFEVYRKRESSQGGEE